MDTILNNPPTLEINVEGILLENKPLSNYDLLDAIKQLNIKNFQGVFNRDQTPTILKGCGIINLADSMSDGTHWVCYFKNLYFDSYGVPPPLEISKQIKEYNIYQIQKFGVVCGHLCLYVLKKLNDGWSFDNTIFSLLK